MSLGVIPAICACVQVLELPEGTVIGVRVRPGPYVTPFAAAPGALGVYVSTGAPLALPVGALGAAERATTRLCASFEPGESCDPAGPLIPFVILLLR
jgi:hypothetical protein